MRKKLEYPPPPPWGSTHHIVENLMSRLICENQSLRYFVAVLKIYIYHSNENELAHDSTLESSEISDKPTYQHSFVISLIGHM